ncbi:MFS transporter [Shewanella submarina]|uniref:MFS transporter n=1 Tax=Shewanella submarina TaxID=2016376 RepID=A0ABV7GGY7_9GAMM|nr:MFS transporter [Shewanella submarina]
MNNIRAFVKQHGLLLLLTAVYIQMFTGRQILAVMLEPIKQEFNASDAQMGVVTGLAFALVFALLCLPAGREADRVNRTHLLAFCAFVWTVTTWLGATVEALWVLIGLRMLVAVAEVPVASASISLISDVYPINRRAFAISIFSSAATFSAILALSLGAYIVNLIGWRDSFALVALPVLPLALSLWLIREPERHQSTHSPNTHHRGESLLKGIWPAVITLWQDKRIRLLILAAALGTLGSNAYAMWNASFLVRSHSMSLQNAGLLAGTIAGGASAVGMLLSGYLADKQHGQKSPLDLAIKGHLLGLLALLIYLLFPSEYYLQLGDVRLPLAMLPCALAGFFSVFWVGPSMAVLTEWVAPSIRGIAVSLQTLLVTLLGFGVGPVVAGAISDILTPWFGSDSLRIAILISNISVLASVILLVRLKRHSVTSDKHSSQQEANEHQGVTATDTTEYQGSTSSR